MCVAYFCWLQQKFIILFEMWNILEERKKDWLFAFANPMIPENSACNHKEKQLCPRDIATGLRKMFSNQQYIMNNEQYLSSPSKWDIAMQATLLLLFNCSWINTIYCKWAIKIIPLGNTFYWHFGCLLVNTFVPFELVFALKS